MERIEIPPKPSRSICASRRSADRAHRPRAGQCVAGYGNTVVFRNLNYLLEKGERVALVVPTGWANQP